MRPGRDPLSNALRSMGGYSLYPEDRKLLLSLPGIELEQDLGHDYEYGDKTKIATYRNEAEGYEVELLVVMMPAQFWTFRITRQDEGSMAEWLHEHDDDKPRPPMPKFPLEKLEVHTGSGTLRDYWPMVIQLARGMADVEYLEGYRSKKPGARTWRNE